MGGFTFKSGASHPMSGSTVTRWWRDAGLRWTATPIICASASKCESLALVESVSMWVVFFGGAFFAGGSQKNNTRTCVFFIVVLCLCVLCCVYVLCVWFVFERQTIEHGWSMLIHSQMGFS